MEHDEAAIIEILNLYGFALDAQQWNLFDRIFTEDVAADFGSAGVSWSDLADFKRFFAKFHSLLDNHQHTMKGHLVHVDGNKANVFSYGNWLLVRDEAKGGFSWLGTGWYDDDDELVWGESGRAARLGWLVPC